VDTTLPSKSDAVAEKETVSPERPSVSETFKLPHETDIAGARFEEEGEETVMIAVELMMSPSLSVALNVIELAPSLSERFAEVPVATTAPPTSQSVDDTTPSESVAVPDTETTSPAAPSLSEIVLSPPAIDTVGRAFASGPATAIVTLALELFPSLSVARKVTSVAPSSSERVVEVPVATTVPPTSQSVDDTVPFGSFIVAETDTDSPALPSVSATLLLPPEIETVGEALDASTVIVTLTLELSPLLSVALNVTEFVPSLSGRFAEFPVATTVPLTSHSVDDTLPSESAAEAETDTDSPKLPSVSATLLSPPEIETVGREFAAATVIVTLLLEMAP